MIDYNYAHSTLCTFPALPNTIKTLKSARAAKLALSKAERAFNVAVRNRCTDESHYAPKTLDSTLRDRVSAYIETTFAHLVATIENAKAQGFDLRSNHITMRG